MTKLGQPIANCGRDAFHSDTHDYVCWTLEDLSFLDGVKAAGRDFANSLT